MLRKHIARTLCRKEMAKAPNAVKGKTSESTRTGSRKARRGAPSCLLRYASRNIRLDRWNPSWTPPSPEEDSNTSSHEKKKSSTYTGPEVPYRFRVASPSSSTIHYTRGTDPTYNYTDFAGLRYPTLQTADAKFNYWAPQGMDRFTARTSPLYLPASRRLSPYLREVIWFLHTLDPIRFSDDRIMERYALNHYTVKKILEEMDQQAMLDEYKLTQGSHGLRMTEAQVVTARKERIYSQRLGYDVIGSSWQQRQKGRGGRFPSETRHDPVLKQAIIVEAMSAFPLPTLRDPTYKKLDMDLEVKRTKDIRVCNWVDPLDKITI